MVWITRCRYKTALALLIEKLYHVPQHVCWKILLSENIKCPLCSIECKKKHAVPETKTSLLLFHFTDLRYPVPHDLHNLLTLQKMNTLDISPARPSTQAFCSGVSLSNSNYIWLANSSLNEVTSIWSLCGLDIGIICWGITVLFF